MSASEEYTEWHLVPEKGWVRGSGREDFGRLTSRPTPGDAVMSITWKEECNGYGPVHSNHADQSIRNQVEADKLIGIFGLPPRHL
jgi:hypothetical protein